jgi:phosphoglycerate dehydrogenase-like enzyme
MSTPAPGTAGGRVVVTWIDFDPNDPETGGLLASAGLEVDLEPKLGARSPQELVELLRGASAAIVSTDPFNASVFEAVPTLRAISRVGVGTDSIDMDAATAAGVVVTVTPGANAETTADHTMALLLSVLRRVVEHDRSVRNGSWERAGSMTPWDLHDKTVGIVGLGQIGRAVAERLRGFRPRLLVNDPILTTSDVGDVVELEELLARSDVVLLHAPLTPKTRTMIDSTRLRLMPNRAILINTARGALVDEPALVQALRSGALRGAGLDVFEHEPPMNSELLDLPNVVLSPHTGGLSDDSIVAMTRRASQNVIDVLAGRTTEAMLNPDALRNSRSEDAEATQSVTRQVGSGQHSRPEATP